MKYFQFFFLIILSTCFLFFGCSDQPTNISSNEDYTESDLSKKPTNDKETQDVKYTSTVLLSNNNFNIVPDYYENKEPISCYDYNYSTQPEDLTSEQSISIAVEANSLNSKDWFNTVLVILEKDVDENGQPDDDGEFLIFGKSLDYYQKFTETPDPVIFYWWGQWRDIDPNTYSCFLMTCEPGQYLLRVSLRQELKNKKGNFGVNKAVYSSVDDPNFQGYEGIALGYVPVFVN